MAKLSERTGEADYVYRRCIYVEQRAELPTAFGLLLFRKRQSIRVRQHVESEARFAAEQQNEARDYYEKYVAPPKPPPPPPLVPPLKIGAIIRAHYFQFRAEARIAQQAWDARASRESSCDGAGCDRMKLRKILQCKGKRVAREEPDVFLAGEAAHREAQDAVGTPEVRESDRLLPRAQRGM